MTLKMALRLCFTNGRNNSPETPSAAHSKNIVREYPQWSGIGVDKTVDKYVRLDMNYTLPNILILLTLM